MLHLSVTIFLLLSLTIINTTAEFKCGAREEYVFCPGECQDICKYGRNWNNKYKCIPSGLCGRPCRCSFGYVRDPVSGECWKKSYCSLRRLKSMIFGAA